MKLWLRKLLSLRVRFFFLVTDWAVAQTCCISKCTKYRKSGKFGYPGSNTSQRIATTLGVNNYVGDPTSTSKCGAIGLSGWSRRMCEISPFVVFLFPFSFLHLAYRSSHLTDFYDLYVKLCAFVQGSAFWGLSLFSPKI